VVSGGVIWALEDSSAGRPGYLLRASTTRPKLVRVVKVGTYASGLAVTRDRVWVVNGTADPRDHAYKDSTVDEFRSDGRLLHEYRLAGAVSIAARGQTAWVNVPQSAPTGTSQPPKHGSTAIDELSAGRIKPVTTIWWTVTGDAPMLGLLPNGQLATVTSGPEGMTKVWFIDPNTARHAATTVKLAGVPSLAIDGNDVLVAVSSVATGGIARVTATTSRLIPGCGNPQGVAASTTGDWALNDTDNGAPGVARISARGCGAETTLSGVNGVAQIASDRSSAWVLSLTRLSRVH
jgi:hypothetical protein